jgi:hypothetical protein
LFGFSIEKSPISVSERSPSAPVTIQTLEDIDQTQRPSTNVTHSHETDRIDKYTETEQSIDIDINSPILTRKEFLTEQNTRRLSFEKKPSNYDILVIESQPPKVNNSNVYFLFIFFIAGTIIGFIPTNINSNNSKTSTYDSTKNVISIWF